MDRNLLISLSIVILLTCFDLKRSYINRNNMTSNNETSPISHDVPPAKINVHIVPVIKVRYCHTCGYQNAFKQFAELVRINYPEMAIAGEIYPPLLLNAFLARILSIVKITLLICLLFGQNPFVLLRIPTPKVYLWALQNRMFACLMIFFLSNSLESYLISTGAFEVSVDDEVLWSKLDKGRLPSSNEFIQMLQTFSTELNTNNGVHTNVG